MAKKAIVILAEGFEDIEAVAIIDILRRASIEVTVASLKDTKVKGSRGVVIMADKRLDQAGMDFDACVLPGGSQGAANLAVSERVRDLIKKIFQEGKVVAAICAAPAVVLAPLGVLRNKTATCFPGMEDAFGLDVKYSSDRVVVDGNIITSRAPGTALVFALAIVEILAGKEASEKIKTATMAV